MHRSSENRFVSPIERPLDAVPMRVVSLAPSLTETLFDLDLGDRLIGITEHCTRPPDQVQRIPRVGTPLTPDIARIVALNPDLVLLSDDANRHDDAASLQAAGVTVWVTGPATVLETLNLLWDIMAVFDHGTMTARVREIERAYDYQQASSAVAEAVHVFAPLWCDPWITFDGATYSHNLLRVCGGINVFADVTARAARDSAHYPDLPLFHAHHGQHYRSVTLDDILQAQPELILLPDDPQTLTQAHVARLQALDIPAVRHEQMVAVDRDLLTWSGTRTGYALRDLPGPIMDAGAAYGTPGECE